MVEKAVDVPFRSWYRLRKAGYACETSPPVGDGVLYLDLVPKPVGGSVMIGDTAVSSQGFCE